MNTNVKVLKKGTYSHEQNKNFIEIKQFIKAEQKGEQVLLFRLVSHLGVKVNSLKFKLTEYDKQGKVISQTTHTYVKLNIESDKLYALERGVPISKECFDFTVQFIKAKSQDYEYLPTDNGVSVYYVKPKMERTALSGPITAPKVSRLHKYNTSKIMFASVLSLLFIMLASFLIIYSNYTKDKFGMSIWLKIAIDVWNFIKEIAIIVANAIKIFIVEIMPIVLNAIWQAIVWLFKDGIPIALKYTWIGIKWFFINVIWFSIKWFFVEAVPFALNYAWIGIKWFFINVIWFSLKWFVLVGVPTGVEYAFIGIKWFFVQGIPVAFKECVNFFKALLK